MKMGYMDSLENVVIEAKYDRAYKFSDGYGIVEINGKEGFIDSSGEELIAFKYDDVTYFIEARL